MSLADEIRIFEDKDGVLVARHVLLEGRGQKRLDPTHRKLAGFCRCRPSNPEPVTLTRAGDYVIRRSLDFYGALVAASRPRRAHDSRSLTSPCAVSNAAKSAPLKLSTPCLPNNLPCARTAPSKMAIQMAKLSAIKPLAGFDFAFQPSLDKNRVLALAGLQFIEYLRLFRGRHRRSGASQPAATTV